MHWHQDDKCEDKFVETLVLSFTAFVTQINNKTARATIKYFDSLLSNKSHFFPFANEHWSSLENSIRLVNFRMNHGILILDDYIYVGTTCVEYI